MSSTREFGFCFGLSKILPEYKLPTAARPDPHPLPGLRRDLEALVRCCNTHEERALVGLLGFEGMRMHEALGCIANDINLESRSIRIMGKGDKVRIIPLTTSGADLIVPQLIMTEVERKGGNLIRFSDSGARAFIRRLGEKANISRPIASHDLRATFATLAYRMTKDIVLVQTWLGHASPDTTALYIGRSLEDMRSVGEF